MQRSPNGMIDMELNHSITPILLYFGIVTYLMGIIYASYLPPEWEIFYLKRVQTAEQWGFFRLIKLTFLIGIFSIPVIFLIGLLI